MSVIQYWKFNVTLEQLVKVIRRLNYQQRMPYHMFCLSNLDTTQILSYFSREFHNVETKAQAVSMLTLKRTNRSLSRHI